MIRLDTQLEVVYPSTVKVTVTFTNDDDPQPDLDNMKVHLEFTDEHGNTYICEHNPFTEIQTNIHTSVVGGDPNNKLEVRLEGEYNLHGKVSCKGSVAIEDNSFEGGFDIQYYPCCYTNIKVVNDECGFQC